MTIQHSLTEGAARPPCAETYTGLDRDAVELGSRREHVPPAPRVGTGPVIAPITPTRTAPHSSAPVRPDRRDGCPGGDLLVGSGGAACAVRMGGRDLIGACAIGVHDCLVRPARPVSRRQMERLMRRAEL